MPPAPTDDTISYGPSFVPALSVMRASVPARRVPQVKVPNQTMQVGGIDAKQPRGGRMVAARSIDGIENQAALGLHHVPVEERCRAAGTPGSAPHRLRQIAEADPAAAAKD